MPTRATVRTTTPPTTGTSDTAHAGYTRGMTTATPDPNHERPDHDEVVPALHDDPEPDEPGGERQAKPTDDLAQDDELRAGQWGSAATAGD